MRLAVTGLGIASAVGVGREAFFSALREPTLLEHLPARPIESFDATPHPDARVAEVLDFDPTRYLGDKGLRTLDRLTKLLIVSARLAMHDSGFKKDGVYVQGSAERVGICCSNAYGSLEAMNELDRVAQLEDARYINPAKFPNTVSNSACGYTSIWEDLRALNVTVSDGNCGALDAVACADIYLENGRAEAILVGGAESMSEAIYVAFSRLGAFAEGTHQLGEGAALFALEPLDLAQARNAKVCAEVTGYGTSFVSRAGEEQLLYASTEAMERAIVAALADADVTPADVDAVASGISGLRPFDDAELHALHSVLGKDIAVAAPKRILGETLGAAGALGMATAIAWFEGAPVAPLASGIRPVREVKTVLVTSMGFYGNASAVIMRKPC